MSLYNLRRLAPDTFMIAKFTDDFEVESTYTLTAKGFSYTCDCPANNRSVVTKPCRHKLMMPTLLPKVDTDRFYDHDTGKFSTPLGDLADLRSEIDLAPPEVVGTVNHIIQQPVGEALRAEAPSLVGKAKYDAACAKILELKANGTLDQFHNDIQKLAGEAAPSPIPTSPAPPQAPTIRRR